jgi:hypothetical protein
MVFKEIGIIVVCLLLGYAASQVMIYTANKYSITQGAVK